MLYRLNWLAALVLLNCVIATGCGGGDGKLTVRGEVTLDGNPLESGSIRFEPMDHGEIDGLPGGTATAAGTVIQGGSYKISSEHGLKPGKYRVTISSAGSTGPPTMDGGGLAEEKIPARYNEKSELTADVTEGGDNYFPFQLETQPAN